ncbi:MAG: vitamin K epoxide reductase family protein [Nitrososphaerales archaeon]
MRISRSKLLLLIVMSVVGVTASSFVFYIYDTLHQGLPICVAPYKIFGVVINCETVLSSKYNNVYGINLDLLAVAYFIVNLALVFTVAFGSERLFRRAFRVLFVWRFLGLVIVPYLITLEFFVVKAICVYCTIMHASILIDFAIVTYFLFYKDITHAGERPEDLGEEGAQVGASLDGPAPSAGGPAG